MSEVTREEFDRLCLCVDKLLHAMQEQSRISSDHLKCSSSMDARLSRVERLADGVKDAVCLVASFGPPVMIGGESGSMLSFVGRTLDLAQQPAPTAEGAGVEVKRETCENCPEPATTHDSEGVPLCKPCLDSIIAES